VREILLKPSEQDLAGTNKNTDVQIGNRVQAHKIDKKAVEWNAGPDREIRTDRFGWSFSSSLIRDQTVTKKKG
jgi:hypothetical protein